MIQSMKIGRSKVNAPKLVLGTFGMGGGTSWQDTTKDDKELIDLIRQAYDLGVWGLDTAPVYGTGRSESIVGQAVKGRREKYFISTKCSLNWRNTEGTFTYTRDGHSVYNNFSKASIIKDVEESLKRMETDYIDLMIIHRCPKTEEFGEVMEAMDELKKRQLIRATGLSNVGLSGHPVEALDTCLQYGELDLLQEGGSLLKRAYTEEMIQYCEKHQITYQAHSSLEKGILTGRILKEAVSWTGDNRSKYKWFQPENLPKVETLLKGLGEIAEKYNCSTAVLSLAWLHNKSECVNLLIGARKLAHLEDSLQSLELALSAEDIEAMNRLSDAANQ